MEEVFIGGSRSINSIPPAVTLSLDALIGSKNSFLIGDAKGVDTAIQIYLYKKSYKDVTIYHMSGPPRNNIGGWTTKRVLLPENWVPRSEYFGLKDIQMAKDCSFGIMVWDGFSSGSYRNIKNLLDLNKESWVYHKPKDQMVLISTKDQLSNLIRNKSKEVIR